MEPEIPFDEIKNCQENVMRNVLKQSGVLGFAGCLILLQSISAQAQPINALEAQKRPVVKTQTELATPSLYIAPQKGFDIRLGASHIETKAEVDVVSVSGATNTISSSIAAAITPAIYLGISGAQSTSSTKNETKGINFSSSHESTSEGMEDPSVFAGMRLNTSQISVLTELKAYIGTGDSESETKSNGDSTSNNKHGGTAFTPKIAVFTNSKSNFLFGGELSYTMEQERTARRTSSSGTVVKSSITGGNSASVGLFFETPQVTHSLGLAASYQKSETQKTESAFVRDETAGSDVLLLSAYGNIKLARQFSLVPAAMYVRYLNDKVGDTELKDQNIYGAGLGLKLVF
jgi:hypothetical protein